MMRFTLILGAGLAALSLATSSSAQDLGSYGEAWNVKEHDAIDQIKGKLGKMEKSGELRKMWEGYRDRYVDGVENPAPLPGISRVSASKTWTFDPTYTFAEDVTDDKGRVLVKAGAKVNPLIYTPLTKALIFIDGRDAAQVAFAKARSDKNPRDKVILVAGSFLKLNREWGRPTYFDQRGHLSARMGIKRVPAVVAQKGQVLEIQEVALPVPSVVRK